MLGLKLPAKEAAWNTDSWDSILRNQCVKVCGVVERNHPHIRILYKSRENEILESPYCLNYFMFQDEIYKNI